MRNTGAFVIVPSMAKILLLNKPFNVLCQFSDPEGRSTLADYVDTRLYPKFYPAGRLDYDSEGLVLLTDDGALQHRITDPYRKLEKTYWVQVEGSPTESDLQPLRQGLELNDGPTRPAKAELMTQPDVWPRDPPIRHRADVPTAWLSITLTEGKNRQVRRMTAAIGFPTLRLIRASIGHWKLSTMAPGDSRVDQVHLPRQTNTAKARRR